MAHFEKVSKFINDNDIELPKRQTANSAGYDFQVAEDIIIYPYQQLFDVISKEPQHLYTLNEMEELTKRCHTRPTLIPTGIKCKLEPYSYLELSVRSSTPLKYWLVLANSVGIIDSDYYNNPANEGQIFFQVINLSPFPIHLKKGDKIGQGIIKTYMITDGDNASDKRVGGFGSTTTK